MVDERGVRGVKASRRSGDAGRPRLVLLTTGQRPGHQNHRPALVVLQGGAGRKDPCNSHPRVHSQEKTSAGMRVAWEVVSTKNIGMATDDADRATRLLVRDLLRMGEADDLLAQRLSRLMSRGKEEARKPQR